MQEDEVFSGNDGQVLVEDIEERYRDHVLSQDEVVQPLVIKSQPMLTDAAGDCRSQKDTPPCVFQGLSGSTNIKKAKSCYLVGPP